VSLKKELTKLSSVVGRGQREIDRERDTATEREENGTEHKQNGFTNEKKARGKLNRTES